MPWRIGCVWCVLQGFLSPHVWNSKRAHTCSQVESTTDRLRDRNPTQTQFRNSKYLFAEKNMISHK